MENIKIVAGYGLGLRPTRKQLKSSNIRKQYREELFRLRNETGINIPFGANLEKFRSNSKATKLSGNYSPIIDLTAISKLKCPICDTEIGAGKDIVITTTGTIYHFDCYISGLNEHERR